MTKYIKQLFIYVYVRKKAGPNKDKSKLRSSTTAFKVGIRRPNQIQYLFILWYVSLHECVRIVEEMSSKDQKFLFEKRN